MRSEDVVAVNREAVRVVLANATHPLSTGEIMAATGLSDRTVRVRRRELVAAGQVAKDGRGWIITAAGPK
jgi:DNA-binding Lrp family transcriptional regulator